MEQLPTKEQILRNHYEAFRDANLKYNLSEWDSSDASVEIGLSAMEEYAAVRAMPLVDGWQSLLNAPLPANEREMESWIATARTTAQQALSSYTSTEGDTNKSEL